METDEKWTPEGSEMDRTYTKGGITIQRHREDRGPNAYSLLPGWEARHGDTVISTHLDVQELMDYCDKFLARLAQ